MQTYLVGGAVRDELLGREGADRDWVVVGATPAELLALGFRPVGKDFPVFLHPQTHEEHALARIERKTGPGYHGFAFHAAPDVTLEQDLERRDLTINAMARAADGTLVDPFGGRADLDARVLRHVSAAFVEDPVRVLRVARFAARYGALGFTIAPETQALMRGMVADGELAHLVPERVWQELSGALREPTPSAFLRTLNDCGALAVVLPELAALYGVPQRADYHPEVDTGVHQEMVSDMAARLAPGDALVGWCALVHDLGKALTAPEVLPQHVGHEHAGVPLAERLARRLKVPVEFAQLGAATCKLHLVAHQALELKPRTVVELFEKLDALRKPQRLETFLVACEADKRGRAGRAEAPYPQGAYLRACFDAARAVSPKAFVDQGLEGEAIGAALRRARIEAVAAIRKPVRSTPPTA
jgi:tRNA nucleotidyltransferase (CCA-adding enzyme)